MAIFGSEAELMFADAIGNDVGKVQSQVAATLRGGKANLFKSSRATLGRRCDDDIGSPVDVLTPFSGVRAEEYAHGFGIKTVVVVVEELVEVARAKKELICQPR